MKIESITVETLPDPDADPSYLGSYSNTPQNPYSIKRENAPAREFQWFNPVAENLEGETQETAIKIAQMDYERMESFNNGNWGYIGVRAKARVISDNSIYQTIHSAGLWGVESDNDTKYLDDLRAEQLAELQAELTSFGFSKEAIAEAMTEVETVNL